MQAIIQNNLSQIQALCKTHKVKELYVFGSVVDDSFTNESDIDLLYRFDENNIEDYFINFFEFKETMEKLLNREVDMVFYDTFRNRFFAESVEQTKIKIYEA